MTIHWATGVPQEVVGAVFLGVGALLFGIQRHVARIAALAQGADGEAPRALSARLNRLLA